MGFYIIPFFQSKSSVQFMIFDTFFSLLFILTKAVFRIIEKYRIFSWRYIYVYIRVPFNKGFAPTNAYTYYYMHLIISAVSGVLSPLKE